MKLNTITFHRAKDVPKGWGKEVQIINFENLTGMQGYSGKFLVYNRGAKSSMHYHTLKHETFYVLDGEVALYYYDPNNADACCRRLSVGDVVVIPPNNPHQIVADVPATIVEFATTDNAWDNFRIGKGDSQTQKPVSKPATYEFPKPFDWRSVDKYHGIFSDSSFPGKFKHGAD